MAFAAQDSCLLVLDSAKLRKSLDSFEQDEMRDRAKYLTDLPHLKVMSLAQRKRICKNSFYKTYKRNQIVFQQGALPSYVYIVVSGEFEV